MKIPHKGELSVFILSIVVAVGGNFAVDKFFPSLAVVQDYVYSIAAGILLALVIFIIYNFRGSLTKRRKK